MSLTKTLYLFNATVLIVGAAFGLVAVFSFILVYGPFFGSWLALFRDAAIWSVPMLLPYLALFEANHLSTHKWVRVSIAVVSVISAALGSLVYSESFGPNDGEYVVVYILVPLAQAPFAISALALAVWLKRRTKINTPND